jgi:anaerobic dimethyl sulfoxide reductase subunit C (anchor subunit)
MTEWPLVVFTICLQLSCGLALAAVLVGYRTEEVAEASVRPLGLSVFPVAALGLLSSLLHLGRPFGAYRAIFNLGHSRLSLEVLFALLFGISALLYSGTWWKRMRTGRTALGIVTAILGLAATASSSAIYLVPTQPAWNSGWVPGLFPCYHIAVGWLCLPRGHRA